MAQINENARELSKILASESIYLSVQEISKKWTMPMQNWGIIIGQFMVFFEERFKALKTA